MGGVASSDAATGQPAEAAAMAKSSYSRSSDATPIGYGTAGFRTAADVLDNVLYRTGLLAALRSKALGKKVGVMVTASHNPEKDNGVKLVEPLGEMLPPEWEAHATRLANSADADLGALLVELSESLGVDLGAPGDIVVGRDTRSSSARLAMALCDGAGVLRPTRVRSAGVVTTPQLHYLVRCENDPTYGLPSIPGYEEKLICAFRKLLASAEKTPRVYTPVVNVDCACGVGAIALGAMLERLSRVGLTTNMVNLVGEGTLNEGCGADFVKTKQKPPAKADLSAGRWVSFDGDADRIVYFFSQDGFCLLDGDRIALLMASFLKTLLTRAGAEDIKLGLVQTAYANGASTARAIADVGEAQVACAKTGVKHCHHAALAFDLGIYFEANGHGTILFSEKLVQRMKSISGTTGLRQRHSRSSRASCTLRATSSAPDNVALVFVKPHACTPQVLEMLPRFLEGRGVEVLRSGSVAAEEIEAEGIIDQHYEAIAKIGMARNLDSLGLGNDEAAKFEKGYGRSLSDAMSAGEVCSAVTAMEILQVEPGELLQRCLDAGYEKLRSGLYCAKLGGGETGQLFVLNGFYARMREKFTKAGVVVHWHVVGFDSAKLPWMKFRSEVIGATNPVDAVTGSLRARIRDEWKDLGLAAETNYQDNGVHASASPLESLRERQVWLGEDVSVDAFGRKVADRSSVSLALLLSNCDIDLGDKSGAAFDLLEELDAEDTLKALESAKLGA